ncbi:hypothetical protein K8R78_04570 [bacterium]|nr:hypothetical protein [bacterium]
MSFKKSVLLLLSVAVFACFGFQTITAAASEEFVEYGEITEDGAAIALELAQEYIAANEIDTVLGEPEPLYGYGYGEQQIAYLMLGHPTGEIKNMAEMQAVKRAQSEAGAERHSYRAIAEERGVEDYRELVPAELNQRISDLRNLIWDMQHIIVAKVEGEYKIIQASDLSGWHIQNYRYDGTEVLLGYALIWKRDVQLDSSVPLSFTAVYKGETNELVYPVEVKMSNIYKPLYNHEYTSIYEKSNTSAGGVYKTSDSNILNISILKQIGTWDCFYASKAMQLGWHVEMLFMDYSNSSDFMDAPIDGFFMEQCYEAYSQLFASDPTAYETKFPPEDMWFEELDEEYYFRWVDSEIFSEAFHDEYFDSQFDSSRNTKYETSLDDNPPSWDRYKDATKYGYSYSTFGHTYYHGNVSVIRQEYDHACVTAGYDEDFGNQYRYIDPREGSIGWGVWGPIGAELCTNFSPDDPIGQGGGDGDGYGGYGYSYAQDEYRIVFAEDVDDHQVIHWVSYPGYPVRGFTVLSRDEAGKITQVSSTIRYDEEAGWLRFATEAEGELGIRYYPIENGEPVDVFTGEEADFELACAVV